MDRVEEKLKRRYSNQEISNDNFDSENLWSSIEADLDKPLTSSKLTFSFKNTLSLIAMLLIGLSAIFLIYSYDSESGTNFNPDIHINQSNLSKTTETQKFNLSNWVKTSNQNATSTSSNSEIIDSELNNKNYFNQTTNSLLSENKRTESVNNAHVFLSTQKSSDNKKDKELFNNKSDKHNLYAPNNVLSALSNNQKNNAPSLISQVQNTHVKNEWSPDNIKRLPTSRIFLEQKNDGTLYTPEYLEQLEPKGDRKVDFEIALIGGFNFHSLNYNSNDLANIISDKKAAETSVLGQNFGIEASVLWNHTYTFSIGAEYSQLWSKFEHTDTTVFQELRPNQLLKVWINTTTGDTIRMKTGNALINGTTHHRIVHFNNFKRFSIPLELGIRQRYNSIEYGMRTGVTLNFTTTQSGRTFNKDLDIFHFDEQDPLAPMKSFGIGVRVNPYIGYRFTDKITMRIHPQWSWMAGNNFDGTNTSIGINQFNLNFGVKYSISQ